MKKLLDLVKDSLLDKIGNISSVRIQGYAILGSILTYMFVHLISVAYNMIQSWKSGALYVPSSEDIIILGLYMTHHLTLLGLKNSGEKDLSNILALKTGKANQPLSTETTSSELPVEGQGEGDLIKS
jgi:hypothetical protein